VATNLEGREWEGGHDNVFVRSSDAILQDGQGVPYRSIALSQPR
jgi:hypothetical protein